MRSFPLIGVLAMLVVVAAAPASTHAAEPFAHGCPSEAPEEGTVAKLNHNPAARKAIVPAGATSVRLCRYWGFAGPSGRQTPKTQARVGRLRDARVVGDRDLLEALTLEFRELTAETTGAHGCPEDEGAEMYAAFSYRRAQPVILDIGLSGCESVGNGKARARILNRSLENRLTGLLDRRHGKKVRDGVTGKRAVAGPPPHLNYDQARGDAKEMLEFSCEQSAVCATQSIGHCKKKSVKSFRCAYTVDVLDGEICRGGIEVTSLGGGPVSESPGVQSEDEGECFYIFAPPGFKEEGEEIEREEAQEAERGKRSRRATGQPGRRT